MATHAISEIEGIEVWDALHFQEAPSAALSRSRGRHLSIVVPAENPVPAVALRLDIEGDVEDEMPALARYGTDAVRS